MIKAIEDKIIVSEMKRSQTKAGIIIPSTAVEPQAYGKILSIGHEVEARGQLKIGDIIVYHKMGGQAIAMDNQMLCCVPYVEIYGILDSEDVFNELEEIKLPSIQETVVEAPSLIKSV